MASPEHQPSDHWAWVVALITGGFSLIRSVVTRRKVTAADDLDSAASRGGHRAAILARLSELEARADRQEAGIERVERLVGDLRRDIWDELEQVEHRLRMRIAGLTP